MFVRGLSKNVYERQQSEKQKWFLGLIFSTALKMAKLIICEQHTGQMGEQFMMFVVWTGTAQQIQFI